MRKAFVKGLCEAAKHDERIFLLTGDLGFNVLEPFITAFPKRFLNVGVAEANLLTVAAGLAAAGYIPFVYSIATFITMRAFEQIRSDIALQNLQVKIVGIGGGLAYGKAGPTHHSIEDIGLMRLLGNMVILDPCEPAEVEALIPQIVACTSPVYLRLERNPAEIIHEKKSMPTIGRGELIKKGKNLAILVTGTKLPFGVEIARLCAKHAIQPSLFAFPTIEPLDQRLLNKITSNYSYIATLEEHRTNGGFGTAILEYVSTLKRQIPVIRFGLSSEYSRHSLSYEMLMQKHNFTPEKITDTLIKLIEE